MTKLAVIVDEVIVREMQTALTDDQAIELDEMLHQAGVLEDNEEVATIDDF